MFDPQHGADERVYVFHGTASTQVLGPERLTDGVRALLSAAGAAPAPTPSLHPDIASRPFTAESVQLPGEQAPATWARPSSTMAEVSVGLGAEEFWDRVQAGAWATWRDRWPEAPHAPLYPPEVPEWLAAAPRWELDPLAPALGPAASGGWVRSPSQAWGEAAPAPPPGAATRSGTPGHRGIGLFQLTDVESFWIFAPEQYTAEVAARCESLAEEHPAFTWLTGYFDARDVPGSLRLPTECLPVLRAHLEAAGFAVDTWW